MADNFNIMKSKIFDKVSNLERTLIAIRQEEDTEDISQGIIPFCVKIMQYFIATTSSFNEKNPDACEYFKIVLNQTDTIKELIVNYNEIRPTFRVPSLFNRNSPRNALISNLQMVSQSVNNSYQIMIGKQEAQQSANNAPVSNIVMNAPKMDKHVFIPVPVFEEEYFKWNLTNPITKTLLTIYLSTGNAIIRFLKSLIFKWMIFASICFGIWNYWGVITDVFSSPEAVVDAPVDVMKSIKYEVLNNAEKNVIYSQAYAIASNKISNYPNSKFNINVDGYTMSGTYNRSQCRKALDAYEQFFKESDMIINKVKVTKRVPYSNYLSTKYEHPASYYCNDNDNNSISFVFDYNKTKEYEKGNEIKKDWIKELVMMNDFYQNNNGSTYNYFSAHQKPEALKRLEELKTYAGYNDFVSQMNNKIFGEKIR